MAPLPLTMPMSPHFTGPLRKFKRQEVKEEVVDAALSKVEFFTLLIILLATKSRSKSKCDFCGRQCSDKRSRKTKVASGK